MNYNLTKYACYMGYISSAVINNFAPLVYVTFRKSFGFTYAQIGILIAFNFIMQAVTDYLGARYAEKIGYRRMVLSACALCGAGLVCLGVLPFIMNPFWGICISISIYALGGGMLEVLVSPIVEAIPGDMKSSVMSLLHSFYSWGQMGVIILSTVFFSYIGIEKWRVLSAMWAIIPATAFVLFLKAPLNVFAEGEERIPLGKMFANRKFVLFAFVMICAGASEIAVAQWASTYIEEGLNVSKSAGDIIGTSMFACMMGLSRVIYGIWGNKISLSEFMTISGVLCIMSYLAVSLGNGITALIGCSLCGFSVGIMWPGTLSLSAKNCPEGGTAMFGILALAGDIGCLIGPETVAIASKFITVKGSDLRGGILVCIIYPIVVSVCSFAIFLKNKQKIAKKVLTKGR